MTFIAEIVFSESDPELLPLIRRHMELADIQLRFGTNRPGASNHQDGVTVPRRSFLVHQPEDIAEYRLTIGDWILSRGPFDEGAPREQMEAALYQIMLYSAAENFEVQGRPDSWDELSEGTIERRRNQNKLSILILEDSGYLRASITPRGPNQYSIREVI